jgi:5,10-methylenetetrahydromethanopterin reductase
VLSYHGAYEFNGPVAELPGGREWLAVVEQAPEDDRHLVVHEQHCVGLNPADQAAWDAGAHTMLETSTVSGTASQVTDCLRQLAEQGVTEIVYQPAGPDIRRELEAFISAVRL